jgi:hypothetical protein
MTMPRNKYWPELEAGKPGEPSVLTISDIPTKSELDIIYNRLKATASYHGRSIRSSRWQKDGLWTLLVILQPIDSEEAECSE